MPSTGYILGSSWGEIGIAWGAIIVFVIVLAFLDIPRVRGVRRAYLETHENLTDEEFIRLGEFSSEDLRFALGIRNAFAGFMRVPPSAVHPSDSLGQLNKFAFDGMDFLDLVFRIERELNIRIPDKSKIWNPLFEEKKFEEVSLRDIVIFLSKNRASLKPDPRPARRQKKQ